MTDTTQYSASEAEAMAAISGMMSVIWIVALVFLIFGLFLNWRIMSKAGYPGALSLLFLVPIVGFIMYIWFAFAEWPVQKKAKGTA